MAYSGWLLPDHERNWLLEAIKPIYPDVIAHHVTLDFGKRDKLQMPPQVSAAIVGVADDGKGVQTLIVEIDGSVERPTIGGTFHITWSIDKEAGFKPMDSNKAIAVYGWAPLGKPISVQLFPKIFS